MTGTPQGSGTCGSPAASRAADTGQIRHGAHKHAQKGELPRPFRTAKAASSNGHTDGLCRALAQVAGRWPMAPAKARGAHGCYTQSLPAGGCAVARGTCALGLHPRVAAQVGPPHLCCCLRARCIHVGGMCACAARHGGGAPTSPSGAVGREGAHTSPAPPRPEGPMQPQALPPRESPWVALCLRATRVCKRNQPHQIPSHTGGPILLVSSLLHQTCFRLPRLHLPVPPAPTQRPSRTHTPRPTGIVALAPPTDPALTWISWKKVDFLLPRDHPSPTYTVSYPYPSFSHIYTYTLSSPHPIIPSLFHTHTLHCLDPTHGSHIHTYIHPIIYSPYPLIPLSLTPFYCPDPTHGNHLLTPSTVLSLSIILTYSYIHPTICCPYTSKTLIHTPLYCPVPIHHSLSCLHPIMSHPYPLFSLSH